MAEVRQKMRGTTLQLDGYSGPEGQLAYDMERKEGRFYDGILLGGYRIPNKATNDATYVKGTDGVSVADANLAITDGFYRHTSGAANIPLAVAGAIMVNCSTDAATGDVTQYWSHNVLNIAYIRVRKTGVWTAWDRVITKSYGDTLYLGIAAQATDSALLGGQNAAFYTNIVARLGYTPLNKAGDTFGGNMNGGGFNLTALNLIALTSTAAVTLAGTTHGLQVGTSAGNNVAVGIQAGGPMIQARNNGVAQVLYLNPLGGQVDMALANGLYLPRTAAPAPISTGNLFWDSTELALKIGDGTQTRAFRWNEWEAIADLNVVTVAQADVINLDNYEELRISYELVPVSNGTSIFLRLSNDNGATFLAGAAEYNNFFLINTGAAATGGNSALSGIALDANIGIGSSSTNSMFGKIQMYSLKAVQLTRWEGSCWLRNSASAGRQAVIGGDNTNQAKHNAIRFIAGTGNISGRIIIEGKR